MIDPHKYSVRIQLVDDPGGPYFVGSVDEVPDVAAFEPTYDEAYKVVIDALAALQVAAEEEGRDFPKPFQSTEDDYSGRITLRMPVWLHRQMDISARREEVSLNQYVVSLLSARSSIEEVVSGLRREVMHSLSGLAASIEKTTNQKATRLIVVNGYDLTGLDKTSHVLSAMTPKSNAELLQLVQ